MRRRSRKRGIRLLLGLASGFFSGVLGSEIRTGEDPETVLAIWSWSDQGISLRLAQLLPDQTRAFFLGRGFEADTADRVGRSGVFQTIFRNDGMQVVEYDLRSWSIRHLSEHLPLRTREVWDREWEVRGIDDSPRIAFRWSLLPTVQRFEPGDYNWGMTSFGLPPGERFDLLLMVRVGGQPVSAEIPSMVCAADHRLEDLP